MIKNFTPKSLLVVLISASLIVGCSDDNDDVALNKCFVTKSTSTYSYPGSSNNSVDDVAFSYNSDNQVIKTVYTSTFNGDTNSSTSVLTYDAKGNLVKQESEDYTTEYTYNSDNKVIKEDGFEDNILNDRYEYEYNSSGQLIKTQQYRISQDGSTATKNGYTTYEYANTTTKNPIRSKSFSQDGLTLLSTTEFEYDDKKTPLSALQLGTISAESENNVTKQTYKNSNTTELTTYTYEYNEKGYPVKVTESDLSNGSTTIDIYTYDCK